ncbi:hypothetical protein [Clostridium sp. JNZ J1-5]
MSRSIDSMIDFLLEEKGEKIKINDSEETSLVIDAQERFNFYCDKFIRVKRELHTGDIVEYKGDTYFVISEIDKNTNNYKGRIRKSNYNIKFFRDNKINAFPVILKTTSQGIEANQFMILPAGEIQVMFQDSEETRDIIMKYDAKFIASKTPYKVIAYDLSINGFLTITAQKDTIGAEDDMTNEVVDRWVVGNPRYIIVNVNLLEKVPINTSLKITPKILDRERELYIDDSLRVTSNNPSVATVNEEGIITGVAQGEAIIKMCNSKTINYIVVGVDLEPISLEKHEIVILGSSTLASNSQQLYNATVTNNLPVAWSLKGTSSMGGVSGVSILNQNGDTCTLKCTRSSKFILICTIKDTNISSEIIING